MRLLLCLLLLSPSIFAEKFFHLEGPFHFTGNKEVAMAKRNEPVYAFTQAGRDRLEVLENQGYTCKLLPRQTYLCSIFDKTIRPVASVLERADRYYVQSEVEFEAGKVSPDVVSIGDSLIVYRFHKKVTFQGKSFPHFDYQITFGQNGDLHKVKFGEGIHRQEFIVSHEGLLKRARLFSDQEEKYYDTFLIMGEFIQP